MTTYCTRLSGPPNETVPIKLVSAGCHMEQLHPEI